MLMNWLRRMAWSLENSMRRLMTGRCGADALSYAFAMLSLLLLLLQKTSFVIRKEKRRNTHHQKNSNQRDQYDFQNLFVFLHLLLSIPAIRAEFARFDVNGCLQVIQTMVF